MTGALIRHRYLLWIVTALLVLGGGLGVAFILIGRESSRADDLAAEANLRGNAVATLAGDVRALREQVKAHGGTPIVPDPTKAVPSLSARAEVPVPIPGPAGASGRPGATGPSGSPGSPGASGAAGAIGVTGPVGPAGPSGPVGPPGPQGAQGVQGPQGEQGPKGDTGEQGPAGPSCPDGYSLQAPTWDPNALVCEKDAAPASPTQSPSNPESALLVLSAVIARRRLDARSRTRTGRHRAARRRGGAHR